MKFTIAQANLDNAYVGTSSAIANQTYTGKGLEPAIPIVAKFANSGSADIIPASDYKLVYNNNTNAGNDTAKVTIVPNSANLKGNSNNSPAGVVNFTIEPADMSKVTVKQKADIPVKTTIDTDNFLTFFDVTYLDNTLVKTTDFSVTVEESEQANINKIGTTAKIKLTGAGNYSGTKEIEVKAVAKPLAAAYASTQIFEYTGKAIKPSISEFTNNSNPDNEEYVIKEKATTSKISGKDILLSGTYANNVNAGTAKAEIRGTNDYAGGASVVEYTINPYNLSDGNHKDKAVVTGLKAGYYSVGSEIKGATVQLVDSTDTTKVKATLSSADYTLKAKTIAGGKLTEVTVVGKGNYKNTIDATVDVETDIINLEKATVTGKIPAGLSPYNEAALKKCIEVKFGTDVIDASQYEVTNIRKSTESVALGTKFTFDVTATAGKQTTLTKKDVEITVTKADITSLKDQFAVADGTYTGAANETAVTYTPIAGVTNLVLDKDYTLAYSNNINAGNKTAKVTITGKGNYEGSFDLEFSIGKATLNPSTDYEIVLPSAKAREYTGKPEDLSALISLKAKEGKKFVFKSSDYVVTKVAGQDTEVNVGDTIDYKITIKNNANYADDSIDASYVITQKKVTDAVVTLDKTTVENGEHNSIVETVKLGDKTLVKNADYTVSFDGVLNKATSSLTASEKKPYVIITFTGNYTGTVKVPFTVVNKSVDLSKILIAAPANLEYDATSKSAQINNQNAVPTNQFEISYEKDGKPIVPANVKDVGTYKATVVGKGAYAGSVGNSVEFTIKPFEISDVQWKAMSFTLNNATYAGSKTEAPTINSVSWGTPDFGASVNSNITGAVAATDFEVVEFEKEWDVDSNSTGTGIKAKVAVKAGANICYKGAAKEATFTFDPMAITTDNINDFYEIKEQTYDGTALEPEVSVKPGCDVSADWVTVESYSSNVNISSRSAYATVIVSVPATVKKYKTTGTVKGEIFFSIKAASIETATVEGIEDAEYTGKAIKQNVEVTTADGLVLTLGKDYKVTYANNVNPGTATVTISGMGNYTGEIVKTFKITKKETPVVKVDISKAKVSGLKTVTYNGKAFKPAVKVVVNGKTLVLNKDYKVAYSNNIKPGTAKVVITGIGSYKGTVTKTFVIKKAAQSITKAVVKKTFKASSLKKKAAKFKINAKAKGKITYKKTSGSKNITVSKSGTVTVKKGTKKGTYTIKVKITAAATSNFNKATVTKTIKVVVK